MNNVTLHDKFTALWLPATLDEDYRFLPAFNGSDEWYSILPILDLNIFEDSGEVKAALYLCDNGKTLTNNFISLKVADKRTKEEPTPEAIGAFGHFPSKLKRYRELVAKLPTSPILDRVIPSFLDDELLSDLIDELEELEDKIYAAEQIKQLAK